MIKFNIKKDIIPKEINLDNKDKAIDQLKYFLIDMALQDYKTNKKYVNTDLGTIYNVIINNIVVDNVKNKYYLDIKLIFEDNYDNIRISLRPK